MDTAKKTDGNGYLQQFDVNAKLSFNLHVGADSDASNKISVKSMKYDTKSYAYDTKYDTKTINRNDNLYFSFYILPQKNKDIFVQPYKHHRYRFLFNFFDNKQL